MGEPIHHVANVKGMIFDEEGKCLIKGLDNAISVEKILKREGFKEPFDREVYRACQGAVNYIMRRLREKGVAAGAIGRAPSIYLVAQNPTEKRLMLAVSLGRGTIGHMRRIMHHSRAIGLPTDSMERVVKQLEAIKAEQENVPAVQRLEAEVEAS